MPQTISLEVTNDHAVPVEPSLGGTVTVLNVSGDTLYYADNPQVSPANNQGSLSAGQLASFSPPQWLRSASLSTVTVTVSDPSAPGVSGSSLTTVFRSGGDVTEVFDVAINAGQNTFTTAFQFSQNDVGKYIEVDGAGTAGATLATTILSVAAGAATLALSATTTVASAAHARWGTDTSAALTSLISGIGPQGTVLVAPGTYWVAPITLLDGQTLQGLMSGYGARLVLKAASNAPIVTNQQTANQVAERVTVADLFLDGNRNGQTSGVGIQWQASASALANDWRFDTYNTIRNVFILQAKGDGFNGGGQRSAHMLSGVVCRECDGNGFTPSYDTRLVNCEAGLAGLAGFNIAQGSINLSGCKAWYSGAVTPGSGDGFHINTPASGISLTSCIAQDNQNFGFNLQTAVAASLTGIVADSNNARSPGNPGIFMTGCTGCEISGTTIDRHASFGGNDGWSPTGGARPVPNSQAAQQRQAYPIDIRGSSTSNQVRLTSAGTGGSSPSASFLSALDTPSYANDVSVNSSRAGMQSLGSVTTTQTPNVYAGPVIAMTLGASITIANTPIMSASNAAFPGQELEFIFTQDGTGGRTITWGTQYKVSSGWTPVTTIGAVNTIRFRWDATAWHQIAGAVGA